jgi:hypothetical protein
LKTVASYFLCLLAVFQLVGGHWLVLQTTAWVQMVVHYSSSDGLEAAFSKTFDGRHPCGLCNKIAQKKATEKKQLAQSEFGSEFPCPGKLLYAASSNPFLAVESGRGRFLQKLA